ncbi:MarR family transcriptional regulator [Radiobacillus kanasensis]|uniref:MarR family winged helix-turn-helix transcriptional regulator n=1 Tax=Radiobacillus kanasensis TaxID=2844358 RepID=UPI001E40A8F1|nr:MarR family transcriptional regulator [Radiobacillus kanasensis]UFU00207.1 MarR family transcriptional regulator [Radiobacillus kanasensis]
MSLIKKLDEFYYILLLKNLRSMNKNRLYKNLTYNSLLYLEIILYNENCTPSFIADTLQVARSAVTIKVNELVDKGLIIKIPSETDGRVSYLKVSPEVVDDYKIIDQSILTAATEIESKYSKGEIETFISMLDIIKRNYRG